MLRLRLADVKATVARAALINVSDLATIADYVNRAQERLLYMGKWVGTYGRYRVCINNSCITLPRELETIEAAAICSVPATIRSEWFEFLGAGPGIVTPDGCIGNALIDRGEACSFDDPVGSSKKLAVWHQRTEDQDATINLQFYNSNAQWVTSSWNGEFIDGENISLSAKGTFLVTNNFVMPNGLVRVYKPITNGQVHLFTYDTTESLYKPLAFYAPDETNPVYRRYLVPSIVTQAASGGEAGSGCSNVKLDIAGKMRFIKARLDEDYLMISQPEAIRLMVQAVKKEEDNLWDDARRYEGQAAAVLDQQLKHYKGDGEVQPITFTSSDITGPAVCNLI